MRFPWKRRWVEVARHTDDRGRTFATYRHRKTGEHRTYWIGETGSDNDHD